MSGNDLYCIRCGKPLHSNEVHYSKDDPDHEEAMCYDCYNRLEPDKNSQKSTEIQSESEEIKMSANVETMFYVREKPWHGLGTEVKDAPTSADALVYAGLDWNVIQKNVYAADGTLISGYKVNVRSTDNAALGIVSEKYKVVQNSDAFQFTDELLGAGVTYETAGALQGGRKVWMLARMPHRYIIAGDEITPYLVVMSSHDGSSGVKVAMTPIRVVCQNTLNLALNSAKRIWTTKHTENVMSRVHEARES